MRGTSGLKTILFGAIVIYVWGVLWAADIDIQNDDVQVPAGQVFNNYTFKVGGIGRLLMAPGAQQFGSIWLERDAVLQIEPQNVLGGQVEILRSDPQQGPSNPQLQLDGHTLTIPRTGQPQFLRIHGQIVGNGNILAAGHSLAFSNGDSSGSSASILARSLLIDVPNAFLPAGDLTTQHEIILRTTHDYSKNFYCTDTMVVVFANVDEVNQDYEIRYTGQFRFTNQGQPGGFGRAVFFGVPTAILNPNQTTVTYYVGPQTFQFTDSITVCGGILGENGRVLYGTVKVDDLSWLRNGQGRFLNLAFGGGKLDLSGMPQGTVFNFRQEGVHLSSFNHPDYPGGSIFVLPQNATLILDAKNVHLNGILEVQGEGLTVIVDCANSKLTPESFGGFKLPADATLKFINVTGNTVAAGNLQGQGAVDAEGRNLQVGSDIEDRSAAEQEDEKEFQGRIQNVGQLDKVGEQTTTFGAGAIVQANSAQVSEGVLVVKTDQFILGGGSGNLEVNGGALMGAGTIGGNLIIGQEGEYRPGSSINVQRITGNFHLQGTAEIEIRPLAPGATQGTPGVDNDLIRVGGSATFSPGARIRVTQDSDYTGTDSYKNGDRYYFLVSEQNQITGAGRAVFRDEIPGMHVAAFGLTNPNTVIGALQGQWIWFELGEGDLVEAFAGVGPNTGAVADLLNRMIGMGLLPEAAMLLMSLSGPEQLTVMQQMAGESIGTSMTMVLQNTTMASDFLSRQIRPMFWTGGSGAVGLAEVSGSGKAPIVWCGGPRSQNAYCPRRCWTPWAIGYGLGGTFFSDGNTVRTGVSTGGLLVGLERLLACDRRAGLFYAYGHSSADLASLPAGVATDNHLWGGYLVREWMRCYLLAVGGLGYDQYNSRRFVGVQDFGEWLRSNHDGWQGLVYGEYGLNLQIAALAFQPYFGLRYVHLRQDGFTEGPGDALTALTVEAVDLDSLRSQLGLRTGLRRPCGSGQASLEGRAAWVHELLDQTAAIYYASLAAAPGAGSFSARGVDLGRDFAWLGVGLAWQITEALQIRADYDIWFNELHTLHTGSGALVLQW